MHSMYVPCPLSGAAVGRGGKSCDDALSQVVPARANVIIHFTIDIINQAVHV